MGFGNAQFDGGLVTLIMIEMFNQVMVELVTLIMIESLTLVMVELVI
jgi:hypothetical protein